MKTRIITIPLIIVAVTIGSLQTIITTDCLEEKGQPLFLDCVWIFVDFIIPVTYADAPFERVPISSFGVYSMDENKLDKIEAGHQIMFRSDIENVQDVKQSLIYGIQVFDQDQERVFVDWVDITLEPKSIFSPSILWTPTVLGDYTATSTVWESMDNPTAFSAVLEIEFEIVSDDVNRLNSGPTYGGKMDDSSVTLSRSINPYDNGCKPNMFKAWKFHDNDKSVCVTPYTLDKLIERKWAKPHTDMVSTFMDPNSEGMLAEHCPENSKLIQGGYYILKDSNVEFVDYDKIMQNGVEGVEVTLKNLQSDKAYAYVFVDCYSNFDTINHESSDKTCSDGFSYFEPLFKCVIDCKEDLVYNGYTNTCTTEFELKYHGYCNKGFTYSPTLHECHSDNGNQHFPLKDPPRTASPEPEPIPEPESTYTLTEVHCFTNQVIYNDECIYVLNPTDEFPEGMTKYFLMANDKIINFCEIKPATEHDEENSSSKTLDRCFEISHYTISDINEIEFQSTTPPTWINIKLEDLTRYVEIGSSPTFTVVESGWGNGCTSPTLEVYHLKKEIGNEHTDDDLIYKHRIVYSCPYYEPVYPPLEVLRIWNESDFTNFPICEERGKYLIIGDSGYERLPLDYYYCGVENED